MPSRGFGATSAKNNQQPPIDGRILEVPVGSWYLPGMGAVNAEAESESGSPGSGRTYEIKRLTPRHRRILRLRLEGNSLREIARMVGMSESMVGYVVRSAVFRAELERVEVELDGAAIADEAAIRARIQRMAGRSLDEMAALLGSEATPPRVRVAVAFAILDRAGCIPSTPPGSTVRSADALGQRLRDACQRRTRQPR